jgi:hypothetical protein
MTTSTRMFTTASDVFDYMLDAWLETPESLAEFRETFGLAHWESQIRALTGGGWQMFHSESEEGDLDGIEWRIGQLIEDAAASIQDDMRVVLWETPDPTSTKTCVTAGVTPQSGLLIISFADDLWQEGGTLWAYLVCEATNNDRRALGLLYSFEREKTEPTNS